MAGIDEGINWEAVIREAKTEQGYLNGFGPSFDAVASNFAQEMSFIWASGNAVKFGSLLRTKIQEIRKLGRQYSKIFTGYINNAIDIYKRRLGVYNAPSFQGDDLENAYSYNPSTQLSIASYHFEETRGGMSGMNKKAVAEAITTFQNNMNEFTNAFMSNTASVHISIFDHAGAQKAAFEHMVAEIVETLNNAAAELIGEAQKHVDEEIDNMLLAQTQTVDTFNA